MTEMVCILCPMGCVMNVEMQGGAVRVEGNGCARGIKYAKQELTDPRRVVTANVRVDGARYPMCPVKTADMVPKDRIGEVLAAARAVRVHAPVRVGDVIVRDVAGTDLVATANR